MKNVNIKNYILILYELNTTQLSLQEVLFKLYLPFAIWKYKFSLYNKIFGMTDTWLRRNKANKKSF